MIPAEAVEAAARKLYQRDGLNAWENEDESVRTHYRRKAYVALEAAAPHILAQGWDEAAAWVARGHSLAPGVIQSANPYRPQP